MPIQAARDQITTQDLERTLRTLAKIVTRPGGESCIPLFERIENELADRGRIKDAQRRALEILQASA